MSELNRFQKRNIEEFIADQEKDLDKMQQHMYDMITLYGLSNAECAALLFSIQKRVLCGQNNKRFLETMGITDPEQQLGVELTLVIQKILANEYANTLGKDGKTKKG